MVGILVAAIIASAILTALGTAFGKQGGGPPKIIVQPRHGNHLELRDQFLEASLIIDTERSGVYEAIDGPGFVKHVGNHFKDELVVHLGDDRYVPDNSWIVIAND